MMNKAYWSAYLHVLIIKSWSCKRSNKIIEAQTAGIIIIFYSVGWNNASFYDISFILEGKNSETIKCIRH